MARGLKWTVPFKSLENRQCQVNIYVEGWTGSSTQLTAAANPFVFDEDDTDNLLDVIRVKTGYLRVIEMNYGDLAAMHPQTNTSHYVTVTYNGTTVFTGFLQAQSFETKWEPGPRVLEFPVMSPLGTLGGKYMPTPSAPSCITLAAALKNVADTMDSGITSIVFPDYMISTTVRTLSYRVNTLNYCPFNDDYSMVPSDTEPLYSPKTVSDFLEDICNCFGLIVHDMPGALVFTRFDYTRNYNQYTVSTMADASPTFSSVTSGATVQDLSSLSPKSDDNTESAVLPVSKLVINYDDDYFPDYELPFNHCKALYSGIGYAIMQPSTDEITSSYLRTNDLPTIGTAGVTVAAYGELDAFGSLDEMVLFTFPTTYGASTQVFKWKLYQVPKYFGYGSMLSFKMMVISTQDHKANKAGEGLKIGIIMKNGNYYRQANGTWAITSGQYISEVETGENGEINIEFTQAMPDFGTPLEVIICACDFRGSALYGIMDMKFIRKEISFFQYVRTPKNSHTIESSNGSINTADITQNITTARLSEGMIMPPSSTSPVGYGDIICDYAYMLLTQHRFTLDTYVLPSVMHYLKKTTIGNSVTKRIVGIGFDLWNDIVTLTAQGSSTL